jgi:hypothetical protein
MSSNKKKVVRQKTAEKEPVGSFYHPTEKTFRNGKCPVDYVSKKGYKRHSYEKKDGTHVKHTYVHQTCVPNKGTPGKVLNKYKKIHLEKKSSLEHYKYKTSYTPETRIKKLKDASKEMGTKIVLDRLLDLMILTKKSDPTHSLIYEEDMKRLKKWLDKNPQFI